MKTLDKSAQAVETGIEPEPVDVPNTTDTAVPISPPDVNQAGRKTSQRQGTRQFVIAAFALLGLIAAIRYVINSGFVSSSKTDTATTDATGDELINQIQLQTVGVMEIARASTAYMPHRYTGTVVPRRTSRLSFQAAERVIEVLVDEGDRVTQGQTLARQDATSINAVVQAATARLNQSQATLDELIKGPRKETIDAARSELEQLRAQVDLAAVTLNRQRSLQRLRAGSAQEYDAARFDLAALNSSVDAAAHRWAELEAGTRAEQIAAQKANVEVARATLNEAQIRLAQTVITAPFSGSITARLVDEGSLVQQGAAILEIIESEALEVHFGASINIAAVLNPGDVLPFTANNQRYEGKIAQINPMLDTLTRTRDVVVDLSPVDAQTIVAGQTVSVEFALPSDQPGFWIPSEALLPQVRGLWSAMVLTDRASHSEGGLPMATVIRRDVELLSTWGTWSRVRGTIAAGDQVVVHGAGRLASNQVVNFKPISAKVPWENRSAKVLTPNHSKNRSVATP